MVNTQVLISGPGDPKFSHHNVIETPKPAKHYKFRYFCPACTGRAFYADTKEKFTTRICANCGHEVIYDPNNWIVNE